MEFDVQNMLLEIKKIPAASFTNEDFFMYNFSPIITHYNLRYGGIYLTFGSTRVSHIMHYTETLYPKVCKKAYSNDIRDVLLNKINDIKNILYSGIDFKEIIDVLLKLMNDDDSFDVELKEKINTLGTKFEDIYIEFLIYVMKIENERHNKASLIDFNTHKKIKSVNPSIIGKIIEGLVEIGSLNSIDAKHNKIWTIEDKIKRNNINKCLSIRIMSAYDEYENVMNIIDLITEENILATKHLFSYYQTVYLKVVDKLLGENEFSNENILTLSNKIFESMDLYIYKDLCNVAKFNLDYESIRYNLFALTVAVFYQCKFLIQMEEVNVSD